MRSPRTKAIRWLCTGCGNPVELAHVNPQEIEDILCAHCLEEDEMPHELDFEHRRETPRLDAHENMW